MSYGLFKSQLNLVKFIYLLNDMTIIYEINFSSMESRVASLKTKLRLT